MKLTNLTWLTSKLYKNFKTSCELVLHIWRLCYNMLCQKRSAIIIINNKQTNLIKTDSGSGPSLEKSTPAPLLFSKIVKTPSGVHSDTTPPVHLWHTQGAGLSGSKFFPLTNKASYILVPVSQWKPRAEQEPFAPNWFASSGLALVWSIPVLASVKCCWRGWLVNLHAPTPLPTLVKVTSGGIFVQEFCYTSGNHGSIWANFCSPSTTTKLVQIPIELPERASRKCSYWKNQLSTWTWTNF